MKGSDSSLVSQVCLCALKTQKKGKKRLTTGVTGAEAYGGELFRLGCLYYSKNTQFTNLMRILFFRQIPVNNRGI